MTKRCPKCINVALEVTHIAVKKLMCVANVVDYGLRKTK